jgi:hypothetical protein
MGKFIENPISNDFEMRKIIENPKSQTILR